MKDNVTVREPDAAQDRPNRQSTATEDRTGQAPPTASDQITTADMAAAGRDVAVTEPRAAEGSEAAGTEPRAAGPTATEDQPTAVPAHPSGEEPGTAAGAEAGAEADAEADVPAPLFPVDQASSYRSRWQDIQTGFVDEPRAAVKEADGLVAEVMRQLARTFADERRELEGQWPEGEEISTEDLRIALRRYRSFFDRLLSV
jgi:hypothetical protein